MGSLRQVVFQAFRWTRQRIEEDVELIDMQPDWVIDNRECLGNNIRQCSPVWVVCFQLWLA
jgi:hypothetical protein